MIEHNRLRERRLAAWITRCKLAIAVGVSVSTVRRWECGKTSPTASQLRLVADAIGTGMYYLLGASAHPDAVAPLSLDELRVIRYLRAGGARAAFAVVSLLATEEICREHIIQHMETFNAAMEAVRGVIA